MLYIIFLLVVISPFLAHGAVPAPYKIVNLLYQQSFDALGDSGKIGDVLPFVQGQTIPGWWSNEDQIILSDGDSHGRTVAAGLYNFGNDSSNDRSLGAITSNTKKTIIFGASFNAEQPITDISISFVGEQYRYGGDLQDSSSLLCDYVIMNETQYENGGWGASGNSDHWITIPQLTFYGNKTYDNKSGPVRFRVPLAHIVSTPTFMIGNILQLRFTSHKGRDGIAIDDLEIKATASSLPTPSLNPSPTTVPPTTVPPTIPPTAISPTTVSPTNPPTKLPDVATPTATKVPPKTPTSTPTSSPTHSLPVPKSPPKNYQWEFYILSGIIVSFLAIGVWLLAKFLLRRKRVQVAHDDGDDDDQEPNIGIYRAFGNLRQQERQPLMGDR